MPKIVRIKKRDQSAAALTHANVSRRRHPASLLIKVAQPEIRVTVPPGLESGRLQIEFSVTNQQDFKRLADKLAAAAESSVTGDIFMLLGGVPGSPESV